MKRPVIVAAVLLAIAFTSYFAWHELFSPEAKLQSNVRRALTDPESARFEGVHINRQSGISCGRVNAKNKLGGYSGFVRFLVSAAGTVVFEPKDPTGTETASELIGLAGRKIDFLVGHKNACPDSPT